MDDLPRKKDIGITMLIPEVGEDKARSSGRLCDVHPLRTLLFALNCNEMKMNIL